MRQVHIRELLAQLIVQHGLVAKIVGLYLRAQEVVLADAADFIAQLLLDTHLGQVEQVVLQNDGEATAACQERTFFAMISKGSAGF